MKILDIWKPPVLPEGDISYIVKRRKKISDKEGIQEAIKERVLSKPAVILPQDIYAHDDKYKVIVNDVDGSKVIGLYDTIEDARCARDMHHFAQHAITRRRKSWT